jgi:hypothetical protein
MIPFLILAACLLAAGFGVLLGSLAPAAFGYALFLVIGVFVLGVVIDAIRRHGFWEAMQYAAFLVVGAVVLIGLTAR